MVEEAEGLKIEIGQRIKEYRKLRSYSIGKLSQIAGVDRGYLGALEAGKGGAVSIKTIYKLAKALDIEPELLTPGTQIKNRPISSLMLELQQRLSASELMDIRVVGYVPAGDPISVQQQDMGYVEVPRVLLEGELMEGLYAVKINGESLSGDGIHDGDYVIVKPGNEIIDGKIYIVKLGDEICVRHIYRRLKYLHLVASNCNYQDIKAKDVEIQGRVILSGNWNKH